MYIRLASCVEISCIKNKIRMLFAAICLYVCSKMCLIMRYTVYPKKYAHGFCFAVLCCGYTLTDFPISIRLTSLALWQSNDCPSASKATPMNMDKYFMWIHYERLHNHNKAKHNKTVCIFLGIYCKLTVLGWMTTVCFLSSIVCDWWCHSKPQQGMFSSYFDCFFCIK